MQNLTLLDMLNSAVKRSPDTEALVFPNARLTYREFSERNRETARSLVGMGIKSGDVVGILMPNCVDNIDIFFASASIGALCVNINNRFRARELRHVSADAGIKVLVTTDIAAEHVNLPTRLQEALPELTDAQPGETPRCETAPKLESVVLLGSRQANGMISEAQFKALGNGISDEQLDSAMADVKSDQFLLMLYTSGTTAMPKGCPLTHKQITNISILIADHLGLNADDRLWNAMPMFHASSLLPMLAAFHTTATFVSQLHFTANETMEQLVEENITFAWPAYDLIWQQILTHPKFDADTLSKIRGLLIVGPPETLMSMEQALPNARILSCYGITECSGLPIMSHHSDDQKVRLGTSGLPFEGTEVQIRDAETGQVLPSGERGLLWIRGQYVIKGYWNDAVKTAESFDSDHWFNTGDLGSVDDKGYVYFHGRLKDTLKVGGENVAAVEVEAYLCTHPAVKVAQVIGIPDKKLIEVPAAFIEFKPGQSATEEELINFCKNNISSFKVPRAVRFVTEWPMSATKIRKIDLRKSLLDELGIKEG